MIRKMRVLFALVLALAMLGSFGLASAAERAAVGADGLYLFGDEWQLYQNGEFAVGYTGLYEDPNYGWWLIEKGTVAKGYTGLWNDPVYGWWLIGDGSVCLYYNGRWDDPVVGSWIIENGRPVAEAAAIADGLHDDGADGWHLYMNGQIASWYYGLYGDANYGWWLVQDGAVNFGYTGLYWDDNAGWWLLRNGTIAWDYTGLWEDPNCGWWLISRGTIDFGFNGLWNDPNCGWWLVENGTINFSYTGLYNDATVGLWMLQNGTIAWNYSGKWTDPDLGTWTITNGHPEGQSTPETGVTDGLAYVEEYGGWILLKNGEIDEDFQGLYTNPATGEVWVVEIGHVMTDYNGIYIDWQKGTGGWLIQGGKIATGFTGMWYDPENGQDGPYYINHGQIDVAPAEYNDQQLQVTMPSVINRGEDFTVSFVPVYDEGNYSVWIIPVTGQAEDGWIPNGTTIKRQEDQQAELSFHGYETQMAPGTYSVRCSATSDNQPDLYTFRELTVLDTPIPDPPAVRTDKTSYNAGETINFTLDTRGAEMIAEADTRETKKAAGDITAYPVSANPFWTQYNFAVKKDGVWSKTVRVTVEVSEDISKMIEGTWRVETKGTNNYEDDGEMDALRQKGGSITYILQGGKATVIQNDGTTSTTEDLTYTLNGYDLTFSNGEQWSVANMYYDVLALSREDSSFMELQKISR